MAMNVHSSTFRDPQTGYIVASTVTFEPKTSLCEVNIFVNGVLHERTYFTDSKTARIYADTGMMDLWLNRVEPVDIVTHAMPVTAHGKFSLLEA